MTRNPVSEFEAQYQASGDPWGYESSEYERAKYDATIAALGAVSYTHLTLPTNREV